MGTDSVFGHLAMRFSTSPENLATEALCFILNQSDNAKRGFIKFLAMMDTEMPEVINFQTQGRGETGEIPDLVGIDGDGKEVFLGEAKFWAGLTDNQPVSYIKRLVKANGKILLFISPEKRFATLWPEILRKCVKAKLDYQQHAEGKFFLTATLAGKPILALTSWRAIINVLRSTAETESDQKTLSDLMQLQGLCDRMDDDAFLPLHSEEMAAIHGKRVAHFIALANETVEKLAANKTISLSGLRATTRPDGWGRYFTFSNYGCMLMFNFKMWAKNYPTPIWLSITTITSENGKPKWVHKPATEEKLLAYCANTDQQLFRKGKEIFIPIFIPTLEEKHLVVQSIYGQVHEILDYIN